MNLYWTNRLGVNGTIAVVAAVNTAPTNLVCAVTGSALHLSWPADHVGWRLEVQTNSVALGLRTNWTTVNGSTATNQVVIPINPGNGCVFFRLAYP